MTQQSIIFIDLKHNVLDTADHFLQLDNTEKHYYRKIKLKIFLASSFYELFFKLKISFIDPKKIWIQPAKYNESDHLSANFKSISIKETLKIAKEQKWINSEQYDVIYNLSEIRNMIMHFSISEYNKTKQTISGLTFKDDEFIIHSNLIKHLIKTSEYLFENSSVYQEFKNKYL